MRFDSYHPVINLIYFVAVFTFAIVFNHPVFVLISYVCAFAYSVKLNGVKQIAVNICLIPLMLIYTAWYSYYNHFGVTDLKTNLFGNQITLEAIAYGLQISITVATILMFLSCMFTIFSTDKIVYLFGRVSPRLSLFLSIILRMFPRIKAQAGHIKLGQEGIGRAPGQRSVFGGIIDFFRLLSITITWTLENFVESAASMKCRGYSLKGRTAFSIYRFDNRDRAFVIGVFLCITIVISGMLLNQTAIQYDPELIINNITSVSYIFYVAYATLLLMPMALQIIGEFKFERLRRQVAVGAC